MKIFSVGDYYAKVIESPPDVKALLKQETGKNFRRIDRFIQLALIGVARCVKSLTLSPQSSVYLTSGQGDLDITIDVLEGIYQQGAAPKPLSFINTVSNVACFNIASYLGLQGTSSFVTSHYFAFERSLELAYLDCCSGLTTSALVGSVDICTAPLSQHRERIGVAADCAVGEGSHWWLLANDCEGGECVAQLLAVKHFNNQNELLQWLQTQRVEDDWYFAAGQYLSSRQGEHLQQQAGITQCFDYRQNLAFYNTHAGAALSLFLQAGHTGSLLHINADPDGRYCLFLVRACSGS